MIVRGDILVIDEVFINSVENIYLVLGVEWENFEQKE
jgi:hypothetical protein